MTRRIVAKGMGMLLAGLLITCGASGEGRRAAGQERARTQEVDSITGSRITAEEAKALEEKLADKPDNSGAVDAHEKLISYYFNAKLKGWTAELEEKWEEDVLWLIGHAPKSELAGTPEAEIEPMATPETEAGYARGKELWLAQTEKHKDDQLILRNAARYLMVHDGPTARGLLETGLAAKPGDTETASLLASAYELAELHARTPAEKEEFAKKALALRERNVAEGDGEQKFYQLGDMAKSALEAGDTVKAEEYANELLRDADKYKGDWNYGNALHRGNIVLGRIALQRGDVQGADKYLLAAAATPGSPQLDSFGPNMLLAKELLAKGERETVVAYLEACGKFWEMGGETLKNWIATVKGGGTPEFGGNLLY